MIASIAGRLFGGAFVASLLLILGSGCDEPLIGGTSAVLAVGDSSLAFPKTYLGYPTQRSVHADNLGRAPLNCQLAVAAPFSVPQSSIDLPGGATVEIAVTFDPTQPGASAGALSIHCDDQSALVAIAAEAAVAPQCSPAPACQQVRFDPSTGQCETTNLPDDAPCAEDDQCLVNPHCRAGQCVGSTRDCDDHNACTRDVCDPKSGCRHEDTSSECPAPSELCKAARCDPSSGCGIGNADDGTPCGEVDCTTANVCLLGLCVSVPVPEGSLCAPASPCTGEGHCHNQVCDIPPQPMLPLWTYQPQADSTLMFPGTVDERGQVYFFELQSGCNCCDTGVPCFDDAEVPAYCGSAALVSLTRDGYLRYRVWMFDQPLPSDGTIALDPANDRLFILGAWGTVAAVRMSDGQQLWTQSLWTGLSQMTPAPVAANPQPVQRSVLANGDLAVTVHGYPPPCDPAPDGGACPLAVADWLLILRGSDGALAGGGPEPGSLDGLVADADGGLYFGRLDAQGSALVATDSTGSLRWSTGQGGTPQALAGGRLFVSNPNRTVSTLDGLAAPDWGEAIAPDGLVAGGLLIEKDYAKCFPAPSLIGIDTSTGARAWEINLDTPVSEALLTSRNTALLMTTKDLVTPTVALHEIALSGRDIYHCDVPGSSTGYRFAVRQQRLYLAVDGSLQVFEAPGLDERTSGWSAEDGNLLRNRRAR